MAITITANNVNGDSSGIDVTAYLGSFASPTFTPAGFGWFSTSQTDFSGNQYAVTEQPNLISNLTKQAIIFESGGGGNSIDYVFATHVVGGDLSAMSFGYGLSYSAATDSFTLGQPELRISGFGIVDQFGAGTTLNSLLNDGRLGSITTLTNLLAVNAINFVGSTGGDVFTGYAQNDTMAGHGGNDILNGAGGIDTAVYSGNMADYTVTSLGNGSWTIADNRGIDGTDTLFNVELVQFADQTITEPPPNTAPVNLALSGNTVAENSAAGTVIGLLSASDADGDALTYTLEDDAGGLFAIVGNELRVSGALDFESAASHEVTVKVSDGNGGEMNQSFTVHVTDVDEAPPPTDATFAVTADATVYQFLPNGNLAAYPGLSDPNINYVMGHASAHGLVALLDFDTLDGTLGSLTAGGYTATLHMTAATAVTGFGSVDASEAYAVTVSIGTNNVAWTEDGAISYSAIVAGGSTNYGDFTVDSPTGTVSVDITALVAAWAAAGSTGPGLMLTAGLLQDANNAYVAAGWLNRESGMGAYIEITPVEEPPNTAPGNLALSASTVAENSAAGTVIGLLSASDADGDALTYTLEDDAGGLFAIVGNELRVSGALDFESATSHEVTVKVSDGHGGETTQVFAIGVTDVDENTAPVNLALSGNTVAENSAAGTVIGLLSASDADGDALTYTLEDDAGGLFAIVGNELRVSGALDFESATSHEVTVKVSDGHGGETTQVFAIGVTDVDENTAPVNLALSGNTVAENSAAGTVIGLLSATDADGDALTYTLEDDAGGLFAIVGNELRVSGALDFESATSHDVTVKVSDGNGGETTQVFAIGVTDVDENTAPVNLALSGNTVAENSAAGTVIGLLSASDADGDALTYTLEDDAGGLFAIVGNELRVSGALDFESATSHDVTVKVSDGHGGETTQVFAIGVTDVDENTAPVNLALSGNTVAENSAAGTVIGLLSASDADGDALTYTLEDDAGGLFAIVGNELRVSGALDFESATSHDVTVKVSDGHGGETTQVFAIGVTDVDENTAPVNLALSGDTVAENSAAGTVIGLLSATDADGDALTYTLEDDAGGLFAIVGNELRVSGALDFESATSHDVTVKVSDGHGGETTQVFAIGVTDVDETPPNVAPVASDDSSVTLAGFKRTINVLSNDTDGDGTLDPTTVAIVDGPAHGTVSVNVTTGAVTYTPTAGYVGADSFTYTVKDNDGATSGPATVSLDVVSTFTLTEGDDVFSGDSFGWTGAGIVVDGLGGDDYIVTSNQGAQPDTIHGGAGNDLIFVGGGNDYVDGGAGDDVIHGRAGIDTLIGGDGNDTFVIRFTDAGTTTIHDDDGVLWHGTFRPATYPASWSPAPGATSGFGIAGLATAVSAGVWALTVTDQNGQPVDLTLAWTGDDLTITRAGNPQTVVIADYVNGTFGITLEDSTPVSHDDSYTAMLGQSLHVAGPGVLGNDSDADGDSLTAQLVSGTDDGLLSFNSDGSFDFRPYFSGTTSFTYLATDAAGNSSVSTVTIDVAVGADTFDFSSATANTVKQATGTLSNVVGGSGADTIVGNTNVGGTLSGGGGNDTIVGGNGDDTIIGGAGNDRVTGRGGDDTFVFREGFGKDTITDFQVGDPVHHDTLDLRGLFSSIEDVLAATSDTPNAVISAGDDSITLSFVNKATLALHATDIFLV